MKKANYVFIGTDKFRMRTSDFTKSQIRDIWKLKCLLQEDGVNLTWGKFDDPDNANSLFQTILRDRMLGIDQLALSELMDIKSNPSPFAVILEVDGNAHRLEYFDNVDDELKLVHDYRSEVIKDEKLPSYIDRPPELTPEEFLRESIGSFF